MTVVAGIDEAGLGPLLGPLTLGFSAFRTPHSARGLWRALRPIVSDDPSRDGTHLVVADSKRVFSRDPRGHARLESTALAFLAQRPSISRLPGTGRELFDTAPPGLAPCEEILARHPWYARLAERLPCWCSVDWLRDASGRLASTCAGKQTELADCGVLTIPEGELNASFRRTASKGTTLWLAAADLIEHLWLRFAHEELELWIDRQGGRIHYAEVLQQRFPMHPFAIVRESAEHSEYVLVEPGGGRRMRMICTPKAEDHSLPVALASCLAKYTRETAMSAFNRYFGEHDPALRPTAGYRNDAWRWLDDARPVLERVGVDRSLLVRDR